MQTRHRTAGLFLASTFFALIGMVTMGCKPNQGNPTVIEMVTVTFNKSEHGTITAAIKGGATITSPAKIAKGTVIVFTATPNTGFTFEKWTGDLEKTKDNTKTSVDLAVKKDVTVSALFKAPHLILIPVKEVKPPQARAAEQRQHQRLNIRLLSQNRTTVPSQQP